jgi:hypothetical protein
VDVQRLVGARLDVDRDHRVADAGGAAPCVILRIDPGEGSSERVAHRHCVDRDVTVHAAGIVVPPAGCR